MHGLFGGRNTAYHPAVGAVAVGRGAVCTDTDMSMILEELYEMSICSAVSVADDFITT